MLQYLLKFSISLAVLYIFYRAVLRPLTFYQCNRFYLLCYSVLSFFIPFINITPWVTGSGAASRSIINNIPSVSVSYDNNTINQAASRSSLLQQLTFYNWMVILFCTGVIVMLIRVLLQYRSLCRIRNNAVLLDTNGDVQLYETDAPVSPFSFGNAIYFNRRLHSEEELQRIVQHEFVHVKQRHTADIMLGELLCVVNWFNPFAWFIRYAIRQNLEFIADNNVLANGLNKKEYQYLLLKVVGVPQYSIANNFNLSNLKKRITMMNKMKSARLHLTKFLFVLPLLVIVLLAFRNKINNQKEFVFTGILYNSETPLQVLPGVVVNEKYSGLSAVTDANGYFKIKIPVTSDSILKLKYDFVLNGANKSTEREINVNLAGVQNSSGLIFTGINKWQKDSRRMICSGRDIWPGSSCYQFDADPDYSFVQTKFNEFKDQLNTVDGIVAKINDSKKPFWFVNNTPYLLLWDGIEGNCMFFDKYEIKASPEFVVWLDGQLMSIDEANAKVNRFEIKAAGTCRAEDAAKKYGVNKNVFIIYWKTAFTDFKQVNDTIPNPLPPPPPAVSVTPASPDVLVAPPAPPVKAGGTATSADMLLPAPAAVPALPANVTGISINSNTDKKKGTHTNTATVTLKDGTKEKYNLDDPKEKAAYIKKYGELPQPPLPPPAIAPVPGAPATIDNAPAAVPPPALATDVMPPVATGTNSDQVENISTQESTDKKAGTHSHTAVVTLKNGTVERYNLNDPKEKAVYIKKYGALPNILFRDTKENAASLLRLIDSISDASANHTVNTGSAVIMSVSDGFSTSKISIEKNAYVYYPKNVLIILDNKELPAGANINDYVKREDIGNMTMSVGETAAEKYGDKAKKGVIVIVTKNKNKRESGIATTQDAVVAHFDNLVCNGQMTGNGNENLIDGSFSFDVTSAPPLIIVNGNEIAGCTSYKAEKGKYRMLALNSKQGIAKYGDKAKYGVLEITNLAGNGKARM